jgi:exodeoxyribonuclease VII large subunit
VQTSKGYADFIKVVEGNQWGYRFFHVLFPSLLQGEKAVESIRYQLARIRKVIGHFDVVAIIRGGGGDVGLSCFNNLQLAREIAMFPIPVITGIGHATNETAVEMISFKNAITPTELADYLLQLFHDFSVPVQEAEERVTEIAGRILKDEKLKLRNTTRYFRSVAANVLVKNRHDLKDHSRTLHSQSIFLIKKEKNRHTTLAYTIRRDLLNFCQDRKLDIRRFALTIRKDSTSLLTRLKATTQLIKKDLFIKTGRRIGQGNAEILHLERVVNSMDPLNVLKRGYSITTVNGKAVKSASQVKEGDMINTLLSDGHITSEITSVKKQEET